MKESATRRSWSSILVDQNCSDSSAQSLCETASLLVRSVSRYICNRVCRSAATHGLAARDPPAPAAQHPPERPQLSTPPRAASAARGHSKHALTQPRHGQCDSNQPQNACRDAGSPGVRTPIPIASQVKGRWMAAPRLQSTWPRAAPQGQVS